MGNNNDNIPIEKAFEFFQGCTDAFQKMGFGKYCQLIDFIEVVKIWPNHGIGTQGQIVIDVVVRCEDEKRTESFKVLTSDIDIRTKVRDGIISLANELAQRIKRIFDERTNYFKERGM